MKDKFLSVVAVLLSIGGMNLSHSQIELCKINHNFNTQHLANNKITKIIEYKINKSNNQKDTVSIYYLNTAYCPAKKAYRVQYNKDIVWLFEELQIKKDSSQSIFTKGEYNFKKITKLYERQSVYYNSKKQIIKTIDEDYLRNHLVIINELNPSDKNKYRRYIYAFKNKDTIQKQIYIRIPDLLTYSLQEFKDGKWIETEKTVTTFKNGEFTNYERYVNGKLLVGYNNENIKKNKHELDEVNFHPLPVGKSRERVDTLYSHEVKGINYLDYSKKTKEKGDFTILKYYSPYQKHELYVVKIYSPTHLIHQIDNINEGFYSVFEFHSFTN